MNQAEIIERAEAAEASVPILANLVFGQAIAGGFFTGAVRIGADIFGIAAAPKALGETTGVWLPKYEEVPGAISPFDGLANTLALAEAGSPIAQWALGLRIAGHDDWFIGSQDDYERAYRHLKPTTEATYLHGRHGENLSSVPPTHRYALGAPVQTSVQLFQQGGSEAFEPEAYWTSTQHSRNYAWYQSFDGGSQNGNGKFTELQVRAFRRFKVQ